MFFFFPNIMSFDKTVLVNLYLIEKVSGITDEVKFNIGFCICIRSFVFS